MNWTRSVKGKGTRVFRGSVALMILQTVAGVKRGEFPHGAVAGDLGDNGSGGDGGTAGVPVNDGKFRAGETRLDVPVDETEVGLQSEPLHRTSHGEKPCAKNIMEVDFRDRRNADRPLNLG